MIHEVRITGIAAGGEGVGRLADGRAVFVHRTAPGDRAEVRLKHEHARWARARLVRLLERSPERRDPPCPHYARCGGCTLEHLTYDAQRRAKSDIVGQALRRIGGMAATSPEVVASPVEFRYRNRVSFTLVRLGGGRVVAGFHELDAPRRILDITAACLLPEAPIADAWAGLREAWGPHAERLPAGQRLRLTLRASTAGRVTLLIEGGGRGHGQPEALLEAVTGLAAIWHRARPGHAPRLLAGEPLVEELWGDDALALTGALFLQVNRLAAASLEAHVLATAGDVGGLRIIDAYCGVGLHARRLAELGADVIGIEVDSQAVAEARRASPPGVRFLEGTVERWLAEALPCDLAILNPPRAGLTVPVIDALRASPPDRIIYVSCDPGTLARDLARLGDGFALRSLRAFDLFPQTAHVESVAELACVTS
jgi:23S rRNA (uracil1939-C5)-methyltransferase